MSGLEYEDYNLRVELSFDSTIIIFDQNSKITNFLPNSDLTTRAENVQSRFWRTFTLLNSKLDASHHEIFGVLGFGMPRDVKGKHLKRIWELEVRRAGKIQEKNVSNQFALRAITKYIFLQAMRSVC